MTYPSLKTAYLLSVLIACLATVASTGGLFLTGLYRDNLFVTSAWKAGDLVTLFLVIPLLAGSLFFARRGSYRARLVWLGTLDYMLYNYAFYLFGARFNWFFLLYVALLALSILALISALASLDVQAIGRQFKEKTPRCWISGYMLFVALGLGLVYVAQSVSFIFTGTLPAIVTHTEHPTSIVFALDLTLLVPFLLIGAVWLLGRRPWGYVLTGILMVKGPAYTLVLAVGSLWAAQAGVVGATAELPLWLALTGLGLITSLLLFGNMQGDSPHPSTYSASEPGRNVSS